MKDTLFEMGDEVVLKDKPELGSWTIEDEYRDREGNTAFGLVQENSMVEGGRITEEGVYPEINNVSLSPNAYRAEGHINCPRILEICKQIRLPVLLSSDSHGKTNVGNMEYIFPL